MGKPHTGIGLLPRTRQIVCVLTLTTVCTALPVFGQDPGEEGATLTDAAWRQIAAINRLKRETTPARQKIDTRLLVEMLRQQRDPAIQGLPELVTGVPVLFGSSVLVDVRAGDSENLRRHIESLGGRIISVFPRFASWRLEISLARLEELAEHAEVRGIQPAATMIVHGNTVFTEGDIAHRAGVARPAFGVNGSGVKACAMSDSVDALAALIASGELPAATAVLAGQSGNPGTSEGTALLEILHDLAPGAELMFATGKGGQAQMAQNILNLAAAGCEVIVDDVFYLDEPPFQDGIVAQAVDEVVADGVVYFSSAGNSGRLDAGTSGVFEGPFISGSLPGPLTGAGIAAHNFGGGVVGNQLTEQPLNDAPLFTLWWSNPLGAATDDYDLYLLDASLSTVIAFSNNTQNGNDDPIEVINSIGINHSGRRLVIVKFSGNDQFLQLNTHRGILQLGTDGQITGHAAALGAVAVAATNVASAGGGSFTGGTANPIETFSSDGPRRIFFKPDGSPVDPLVEGSNATRGFQFEMRWKPDITAADGVRTTTPGFTTFFGTSASAPHAAGMAVLLRSKHPGANPPLIRDWLTSSALDVSPFGLDRNAGHGIGMADFSLAVPVFNDGFESGDTSAWSGVVP